jgi:hypothetical protein
MAYPPPDTNFWARVVDEARCREVDGLDGRCQLVLGHDGQHLLQRDGQRYGWPVGAEVVRPPWAPGGYPQDE